VHIWDGHIHLLNNSTRQGLALAHEYFLGQHFGALWQGDLTDLQSLTIDDCIARIAQRLSNILESPASSDGQLPQIRDQGSYETFERLLAVTQLTTTCMPSFSPTEASSHSESQPLEFSTPSGELEGETYRKLWGNGISPNLDDRDLALESAYGFSKKERKALSFEVHATCDQSRENMRNEEHVLKQASSFALNVALSTAKTLQNAFCTRVVRTTDGPQIAEGNELPPNILTVSTSSGNAQPTTSWRTAFVNETGLILPLEFQPPKWPDHCQDFEIHELFILTPDVLVDKIEKRIAKRVHRTHKQLRLSIKHALARDMFSFNTNKAVIQFVCDPHEIPNKGASDVTSLKNYVHPRSLCVTNAYRYAQRRLLSGDTEGTGPPEARWTDEAACMFIQASRMKAVVTQMRQNAEENDPSNVWAHHAHFALYVAAYLEAATAHRESAQLFHFPFTIDTTERLAFLADKPTIGSEARFVGLGPDAIALLAEYHAHILWLIEWVRPQDKMLAEAIEIAVGIRRALEASSSPGVGMLFTYTATSLKSISTEQIQEEMTRIDMQMGNSPDTDFGARAKRRNLITFLANVGASGMDLEVQLGHNGDQHLFGPASNWIPLERMQRMQPLIDRYLLVNGWEVVRAIWARKTKEIFPALVPQFESSNEAYEGRALSADAAKDRARSAIIAALPPIVDAADTTTHWGSDQIDEVRRSIELAFVKDVDQQAVIGVFNKIAEGWKLDDVYEITPLELKRAYERYAAKSKHSVSSGSFAGASIGNREIALVYEKLLEHIPSELFTPTAVFRFDETKVELIRAAIRENLVGDRLAQAKVLSEFSKLANKWRKSGQYLVTATSVNLARFAPGPVKADFGRHLAIARHVKVNLADAITDYFSKAKGTNSLERIAVIAVLLVVRDAVLNLLDLKQLIDAIQTREVLEFRGQYHIRATVQSKKAIYDRTADLTPKTAAAVFGYLENRTEGEYFAFTQIEPQANALITRIVGRTVPLNVQKLIEVMKPFWFLRLPGSVYSTCVGYHDCQAPSEESVALLLGAKAEPLEIPRPERNSASKVVADTYKLAAKDTRDFLNAVLGRIEQMESSSRAQRARLKAAFKEGGDQALIGKYLGHQIVDFWVRFLKHQLEFGGKRVATYDFRTLPEYQSRVLIPLYKHAWDADLTELAKEDFDALYDAALEDVELSRQSAATIVLRLFHDFLRKTLGSPKCNITGNGSPLLRCARSVVISHAAVEESIREAVHLGKSIPQIGSVAGAVAAVNYMYGLRTKEGYGLLHSDFLEQDIGLMRVSRNRIRNLKTSERTIAQLQEISPQATASGEPFVRSTLRRCFNQSRIVGQPNGDTPIFPNPTKPDELAPYTATIQMANWSIKTVTGDIDAIPYSLRHTYATAVMSSLLMPQPTASPIAIGIVASLGRHTYVGCGLQDRTNYPFQVDRLAMSLGQEGVETLSTVYWHGAWWVAGEYCSRQEFNEPSWKDKQLGALLGKHPSVISKRRASLKIKSDCRVNDSQVVSQYVDQSTNPLVAQYSAKSEICATSHDTVPFSLQTADILLVLMRQYADSAEVADIAFSSYSVNRDDANRFISGYESVRRPTGFNDFEPDEYRQDQKSLTDVFLGETRRRNLLAGIEQQLSSPSGLSECKKLVSQWCDTINHKAPLLISHSGDEFKTHIAWLERLGYQKRNFQVTCNSKDAALGQVLVERAASILTRKNLSRMHDSRNPVEIGIELSLAGPMPNNAEFHRVMFALACCSSAGLHLFAKDGQTA
jgi:hypothetical protein